MVNSNLDNKAGLDTNNYTAQQTISAGAGIGAASYHSAPLAIRAPYDTDPSVRAMIALENKGQNAGVLLLDIDNRLKWVDQSGVVKVIDWT